jgi:MarR family transcriptional regulator, 2-MHQ and catechol-resistance regulon repressor
MKSATTKGTAAPDAAADTLRRDAQALQAAVSDLVRVYQFRDRDRICCHDISVTQCYALEALVERGPLRLSALAEQLFLDKSTTSRVVTTLVRKGYVEQRPDIADGRAVALTVTRTGRRLYDRINDDLVAQHEALLQDLDPVLREGATRVIRRLAQAADARFRSGVSVGGAASCCGPVSASPVSASPVSAGPMSASTVSAGAGSSDAVARSRCR